MSSLDYCFDWIQRSTAFSVWCNQLKLFTLFRCTGITDSGILAIARGCPGLEMINIAYCKEITDYSLMLFSKCTKLNTIECRGCPHITSLGLATIAAGCKQLTKLDIKKCYKIDDTGMIPLAHFSQNLKQVLFLPLSLFVGTLWTKRKHWNQAVMFYSL